MTGEWQRAWRLARRDMLGSARGLGMFVVCLALGIGAIATIGTLKVALHNKLVNDGRTLLGGDVEVVFVHRDALPEEKASFFQDSEHVSRVITLRTMARQPLSESAAQAGAAQLVELKAVDQAWPLFGDVMIEDSLHMGKLAPMDVLAPQIDADGVTRPGALIDPVGLERLSLALGEVLRLGEADFTIRGILISEPDRHQAFDLGPRIIISDESLSASGLQKPGSLYYVRYRVDLQPGVDPIAWRNRLADAFPEAGWRLRDRTDPAPAVQQSADRFSMFLVFVSLATLVIGGVGIGLAVKAHLERRSHVLALFKCLGATHALTCRIYALQIGVLALLAIAMGLVLGLLAPFVVSLFIEESLSLRIRTAFGSLLWAMARALIFGILVSLVFVMPTLWRARDLPARLPLPICESYRLPWRDRLFHIAVIAALVIFVIVTAEDASLAAWFVIGFSLAIVIFRSLAGMMIRLTSSLGPRWGTHKPRLRLALSNLNRPGTANVDLLVCLGLALAVLVALSLIEESSNRYLRQNIPDDAPSFYFFDIQPQQVDPLAKLMAALPDVRSSDMRPMLRGHIVNIGGRPAREADVDPSVRWALRGDRGFTYAVEPPEGNDIVSGQWWPSDYSGPPLVSLTSKLAKGLGVDVGDDITVNILGRNITARIANLRRVSWRRLRMNFTFVFAPGALEQWPHSYIATVKAPPEAENNLFSEVTQAFPSISVISVRETLGIAVRVLSYISDALKATGGFALAASILVLMGGIAVERARRAREAVLLKVLGATRRDVITVFAMEFTMIGLAVAVVAIMIGLPAAWAILTFILDTPFFFDIRAIALGVAPLLPAIVLGGLVGIARALAATPAVALRNA